MFAIGFASTRPLFKQRNVVTTSAKNPLNKKIYKNKFVIRYIFYNPSLKII